MLYNYWLKLFRNSFITYTDLILPLIDPFLFSRPDPTADLVSIEDFIPRSVTPELVICVNIKVRRYLATFLPNERGEILILGPDVIGRRWHQYLVVYEGIRFWGSKADRDQDVI